MKKAVLFLFVALVSFGLSAQAKIEFKQSEINYGKIAKGSDGVRVFEFTNTGDKPLVIEDVKSSCGCTVPEKPTGPIAPGESSTIKVKYDTNRVGPIRKTITVYSNAENKVTPLKIKGEVLAEGQSVLEKTR
jgi:hypothetical protein